MCPASSDSPSKVVPRWPWKRPQTAVVEDNTGVDNHVPFVADRGIDTTVGVARPYCSEDRRPFGIVAVGPKGLTCRTFRTGSTADTSHSARRAVAFRSSGHAGICDPSRVSSHSFP